MSPNQSDTNYFSSKGSPQLSILRQTAVPACFQFAKLKAVSSSGRSLLIAPLARSQRDEEGISPLTLVCLSHLLVFMLRSGSSRTAGSCFSQTIVHWAQWGVIVVQIPLLLVAKLHVSAVKRHS